VINTSAAKGYRSSTTSTAVVKKTQSKRAIAAALKAFLKWTLTTGAGPTFLSAVGFQPLPAEREDHRRENQIAAISGLISSGDLCTGCRAGGRGGHPALAGRARDPRQAAQR